MEDFNDDYSRDFDDDFDGGSIMTDPRMQEILYKLKLKLANENFKCIVKNGIDFKAMVESGIKIEQVVKTLNEMLDIFLDIEEYEKCASIKKILDKTL